MYALAIRYQTTRLRGELLAKISQFAHSIDSAGTAVTRFGARTDALDSAVKAYLAADKTPNRIVAPDKVPIPPKGNKKGKQKPSEDWLKDLHTAPRGHEGLADRLRFLVDSCINGTGESCDKFKQASATDDNAKLAAAILVEKSRGCVDRLSKEECASAFKPIGGLKLEE